MEERANRFLETEPVGRLMGRYAVPCIISLLVAALYNIVDQVFIANAAYLGSYGNAANTVVFPLTVVALAVAVLIGDGCCAYVSICLGSGDRDKAHRSIGNAVGLSLVCGVVLAAVYLAFSGPLLTMFGGRVNAETFGLAQEYFFYITLGIPFYMFGQAANPIIRSDGSPRFAMGATLAGAVVNLVLDPVFIFAFRWGMMGAAVATVLGQILTAVLSVWYLCRMKAVRLSRESFRPRGRLLAKFLPLGICSLLSQISLVAAMAAVNNMVRRTGAADPIFSQEQYAQIPMAVVGIVMKFFQIVISIAVGLAAGCIPVVGYNIGAGRKDRAGTAAHTPALRGGSGGTCGIGDRGAAAPAADRPVRRGQREQLLYGVCGQVLPDLPVHGGVCLREQGDVHLFAVFGPGAGVHLAVHGQGAGVRRGLCTGVAGVFRPGRRALLHAGIGSAHICDLRLGTAENLWAAAPSGG